MKSSQSNTDEYHNIKIALPLLAGIGLTILAQYVALHSAWQSAEYWQIFQWTKARISANGTPITSAMLFVTAGWFYIIGIRKTNIEERIYSTSLLDQNNAVQHEKAPKLKFWFTSLGLSMLATYYANSPLLAQLLGYWPFIIWLVGMGIFIYSALEDSYKNKTHLINLKKIYNLHKKEFFILSAILLFSFFFRWAKLEYLPYPFINDEGQMGNTAYCLLKGACKNLFGPGWAGQFNLAFIPTTISLYLFGLTSLAVRLPSNIIGTCAVLFVYLFTREAFGKRTAIVTGILAATFPYHIQFSRLGVSNIIDSATSSLLLWLLIRGIRKNTPSYFVMAGIISGLSLYTYLGSRLSILLGVFAVTCLVLRDKKNISAKIRNLSVYIYGFFVTGLPALYYFSKNPNDFMERINAEGIFQNGVVQNSVHSFSGLVSLLIEQIFKSSFVYGLTPGVSNFFNTPAPYLNSICIIGFFLGIYFLISKIQEPIHIILLAWFITPIILGSALTGGPPSNQRMLGSSMAAIAITALGFVKSAQVLEKLTQIKKIVNLYILLPILLTASLLNINFYFNTYPNGHYFEDPSDELIYESRLYTQPLGQSARYYLISTVEGYSTFGNFQFFSPTVEHADFNVVTRKNLSTLPNDKDILFLASPTRLTDIKNISVWIPNGEWHEQTRRYHPDQILFYTYKVPNIMLKNFLP